MRTTRRRAGTTTFFSHPRRQRATRDTRPARARIQETLCSTSCLGQKGWQKQQRQQQELSDRQDYAPYQQYEDNVTRAHATGDLGWIDPKEMVLHTQDHYEAIKKLFEKLREGSLVDITRIPSVDKEHSLQDFPWMGTKRLTDDDLATSPVFQYKTACSGSKLITQKTELFPNSTQYFLSVILSVVVVIYDIRIYYPDHIVVVSNLFYRLSSAAYI